MVNYGIFSDTVFYFHSMYYSQHEETVHKVSQTFVVA